MFAEDDLLPLSALNHYLYCKRRCALIHIEQVWTENLFTAEGRIIHERVDSGEHLSRNGVRIETALALRSLRLGLSGKADVVEFHRDDQGGWRPYPVEYKRGKPKQNDCDLVQLCAQALCLEEMLGVAVPEGALYYGKPHRRLTVVLDDPLREKTMETARRLHELIRSGHTPQARYEKKCESCSLLSVCMPKVTGTRRSVKMYMAKALAQEI